MIGRLIGTATGCGVTGADAPAVGSAGGVAAWLVSDALLSDTLESEVPPAWRSMSAAAVLLAAVAAALMTGMTGRWR